MGNERIIGMYAGGMTLKKIQNFLEDQYEIELSTEFISTVTNSINEDVREWQQRPLESLAIWMSRRSSQRIHPSI